MTSIQMPQLGETIVEGTILKWLKQEGEHIDVDEPLFELSTDKVDTEVPSPVSGTVTKILVAEGTTVAVGTALAEVDSGDGAASGTGMPPGRRRRRTIPPRRTGLMETLMAPRLQGPPLPPPLRLTPLRPLRRCPLLRPLRRCRIEVLGRRSFRRSFGNWLKNTSSTCRRSRGAGPGGGSRRRT